MNFNLRHLLAPLLALAILVVIGVQTSNALKDVGGRTRRVPGKSSGDPYFVLDQQIARSQQNPDLEIPRDPFTVTAAPRPVVIRSGVRRPQPVAVVQAPPRPVVTAIVNDEDPRALIRYEEKNYSVKKGDLFAEFRVVSITGDQVVLDGPGGTLVLRRPTKGD